MQIQPLVKQYGSLFSAPLSRSSKSLIPHFGEDKVVRQTVQKTFSLNGVKIENQQVDDKNPLFLELNLINILDTLKKGIDSKAAPSKPPSFWNRVKEMFVRKKQPTYSFEELKTVYSDAEYSALIRGLEILKKRACIEESKNALNVYTITDRGRLLADKAEGYRKELSSLLSEDVKLQNRKKRILEELQSQK